MEMFEKSDCVGCAGDDAAGAATGAEVVGGGKDAAGPGADHWPGGKDTG